MVYNHIARKASEEIVQKRIDTLQIGQKMQDLPEELWHESFRYYVKEDKTRKGGPNMRMIRLVPTKPSLTVTGYIFNKFVHPYENRFITVREAARLQGFPDDIEIKGTLTSTQQQIGNAVPVQLAEAVFSQIINHASEHNYKNKELKAFSLFCGAGGMDIGASLPHNREYHISVKLAIDIWNDACDTLRGYKGKETKVLVQDISKVDHPLEYWKQETSFSEAPDVILGGPPCQAFSQAGKQRGVDDSRGQLVYQYVRFIESLRPSYFVMENVSNIVSIEKGRLYKDIISSFNKLGYNVSFAVLCAADFGAPQLRRRAIFIGCKTELGVVKIPEPCYSESPNLLGLPLYRTVQDAFEGLPKLM